MRYTLAIALSIGLPCVYAMADGLDSFLSSLNVQARADMNGFSARICAQFGTPEAQVRAVLSTVSDPADAFMVFQLGRMTQTPPDRVLEVYRGGKRKGWGALAKELGIKQIINNAQCKYINSKEEDSAQNINNDKPGKKVSFEEILQNINITYKNDPEKSSDMFMFLYLIPHTLSEYEKSKGCKQEMTENDFFSTAIESLRYSIDNTNHSQEKKERLNIILKQLIEYSNKTKAPNWGL